MITFLLGLVAVAALGVHLPAAWSLVPGGIFIVLWQLASPWWERRRAQG